MAVAHNQIAEVIDVIVRYIQEGFVSNFLYDLKRTKAYEHNRSFKETVDRLRLEWAERLSMRDR